MIRLILSIGMILVVFLGSGQNARLNTHTLDYKFETAGLQITEEYSITILSEKGDYFGIVSEYYDKGKKIKTIQVEVLDKSGNKVRKYSKSDAIDVAYNDSYEVTDTRKLIVKPNFGSYPYTLNVKVISEIKWLINIPPWIPRPSFELEVAHSKFTVTYPTTQKIRLKQQNLADPTIRENPDGTITKEWSVQNLPSVDRNVDYMHFFNTQPIVYLVADNFSYDGMVGDQSSWKNLGDWFIGLNIGRDNLSAETRSFLDALPPMDSRELARTLYYYMQDRTRYISIQLGIGGFQAIAADVVDKTGFGDCKALTNYMMAMLSYKGVNSNYVLVKAGENVPDLFHDFPSSQFNHVFLGIPMKLDTIFLECTSQSAPFNYLGTFTDDRHVLWCEPLGSQLIRSPRYKEDFNVKQVASKLVLDEQGNGTITLREENNGYFFDNYDYYRHLNKDQVKAYNYDKFSFKDFTILDYKIDEPRRDLPTFTSQFQLNVNGIAGKSGENLIVPFFMINSIDQYVHSDQYKKHGKISRGFTLIDKVELVLPKGFFIENLPQDQAFDSSIGSYSAKATLKDGTLIIEREVVMYKGTYDQDKFTEFYQFIKKVKSSDNRKILISSKT